jgi:hypothetical protein
MGLRNNQILMLADPNSLCRINELWLTAKFSSAHLERRRLFTFFTEIFACLGLELIYKHEFSRAI